MENLNFDISVIEECIEELSEPITDRKSYFDKMVYERIEKCNRSYMDDFDEQLRKIEDYAMSPSCDLIAIGNMMKRLSRLTQSIYKTELSLYKVLS